MFKTDNYVVFSNSMNTRFYASDESITTNLPNGKVLVNYYCKFVKIEESFLEIAVIEIGNFETFINNYLKN